MQVVSVGALDLHGGEFAPPQRPARRHTDSAVDLRSVALAAALGPTGADLINDALLAGAAVALEAARRDRLLALHEAVPALFFDLIRHSLGKIVGSRAFHRLVAEAADPVERRLIEPIKQKGEFLLGLAWETDDEGRTQGDVRTDGAPGADAVERLFLRGRPPHALEHGRGRMLERHVEVGQDLAFGHQWDDSVRMPL